MYRKLKYILLFLCLKLYHHRQHLSNTQHEVWYSQLHLRNFQIPVYMKQYKAALVFLLNFTNFKKINKKIITNLKLNANNARLNNQLNINGLNLNISSFELKIDGINGIEISENPFLNNNNQFMYFHLSNSNFQFFYRNKFLSKCICYVI